MKDKDTGSAPWKRPSARRRPSLQTTMFSAVMVYAIKDATFVRALGTAAPLVDLLGEADGATLLIHGGRMPTEAEIERAISVGAMTRAVDVRWHLAPPKWFGSRDCFSELETVTLRSPAARLPRPPMLDPCASLAWRRGRSRLRGPRR